jgi:hypothetical protein
LAATPAGSRAAIGDPTAGSSANAEVTSFRRLDRVQHMIGARGGVVDKIKVVVEGWLLARE